LLGLNDHQLLAALWIRFARRTKRFRDAVTGVLRVLRKEVQLPDDWYNDTRRRVSLFLIESCYLSSSLTFFSHY